MYPTSAMTGILREPFFYSINVTSDLPQVAWGRYIDWEMYRTSPMISSIEY